MPFHLLLGAFVVAQLLGLASPCSRRRRGSFEGTMVLVAGPFMEPGAVLPALIVYRVVYYLAAADHRARGPRRRRDAPAAGAGRADERAGSAV
jgi:hypothetical protein